MKHRVLLRLLQPVDLSGVRQHPADGGRVWRYDHLAADPGRRHLQHHQPERLRRPRAPGAGQGALLGQGLQDWARVAGLKIKMPPSVFPVNSVKVMRGCIVLAPQSKLVAFARAAFRAYWSEDKDISKDEVVAEICARAGVDAPALFAAIAEQGPKDVLRANTDEVMARGGFGSPTIFVNGADMYFRQRPPAAGARRAGAGEQRARPDAEGGRLPRARPARKFASRNLYAFAAKAGTVRVAIHAAGNQLSRHIDGGR